MANPDIEQPVTSGNSGFDRWIFRLWAHVRRLSPSDSSVVISGPIFGNHAPISLPVSVTAVDAQAQNANRIFAPHIGQPPQNGADIQNLGAVRSFSPRPINTYQSLTAVDSAPILAGQIFGS